MRSRFTKAVIVASLFGSSLALADTDTRLYHGNTSVEYISFSLASLSAVEVGYSWSDMLLTKNKYSSFENNAASLTWTLSGATAVTTSFSDPTGKSFESGILDLGQLAAGSYTLTLSGRWNPVTLAGSEKAINGWSVTNGKVNITKDSLSIAAVSAVPEPESYAMLLAGLGLMGFVARRRKAKTA